MVSNGLNLLPDLLLQDTDGRLRGNEVIVTNYVAQPDISKKFCFSPMHLLIYVHSGMQIIHHQNNSFMLGEGEAGFIKCGDFYLSEMATGSVDFQGTFLFLSDNFINQLIHNRKLQSAPAAFTSGMFKLPHNDLLKANLPSLSSQLLSSAEQSSSVLEEKVLSIMNSIGKTDSTNTFDIFLQSLPRYPKIDPQKIFTDKQRLLLPLSALARISGLTPAEFESRIAQTHKTSPQEWLNNMRLEYAYTKLVHTPDDIDTIALSTGFDNPAEFSALFKQKFGQSPEEVSATAGR